MSLLFGLVSTDAAPRIGLAIAAVLTLVAGVVSTLRMKPVEVSPTGV